MLNVAQVVQMRASGTCREGRPRPSTAVVERVADLEGVDSFRLEPPLNDVIDPDALDALFAGRSPTAGYVSFEYCGYTVAVQDDGNVAVVDPETPPESVPSSHPAIED